MSNNGTINDNVCHELDVYVDPPAMTMRRVQALQRSAEVEEQQKRADFMQFLYQRSGRTCGTLSGLYQEFKAELLEKLAQRLADEARDRWAKTGSID